MGGNAAGNVGSQRARKVRNCKREGDIKMAICAVAELLGNSPAICRKCYVLPASWKLTERQANCRTRRCDQNTDNVNDRAVERAIFEFLARRSAAVLCDGPSATLTFEASLPPPSRLLDRRRAISLYAKSWRTGRRGIPPSGDARCRSLQLRGSRRTSVRMFA